MYSIWSTWILKTGCSKNTQKDQHSLKGVLPRCCVILSKAGNLPAEHPPLTFYTSNGNKICNPSIIYKRLSFAGSRNGQLKLAERRSTPRASPQFLLTGLTHRTIHTDIHIYRQLRIYNSLSNSREFTILLWTAVSLIYLGVLFHQWEGLLYFNIGL